LLPTLSAYVADFTTLKPPPPAQPTYAITTTLNGSGQAMMWNLVADPPAFTPGMIMPPDGATVAAGQDLLFTWPLQPEADYETLELFVGGSLALAYASPAPNATDVNHERVPGANLATPGTYLVNLAFVKANCPPSAAGCVYSSTVKAEQITVK
jgi:hypothetical protein